MKKSFGKTVSPKWQRLSNYRRKLQEKFWNEKSCSHKTAAAESENPSLAFYITITNTNVLTKRVGVFAVTNTETNTNTDTNTITHTDSIDSCRRAGV